MGISNVVALVLANLNDEDEFSSYLESFEKATTQLLADEFKDDIPDINSANASLKITDIFGISYKSLQTRKKHSEECKNSSDILQGKKYYHLVR